MFSIKKSVVVSFSLFVIDAFVLNQGGIALFIMFAVLPFLAVKTIKKRKDPAELKKGFIITGIYIAMVVLVFTSNYLNNVIAKKRAEVIIEACEQYRIRKGFYPPALSALVPEFLKKIPKAKYTLLSSQYRYIASANRHSLIFVSMPPFGRSYYVLEERRWGLID